MLEMKLRPLVKRIIKEQNNLKEIEIELIKLFTRIGIDRPDNFDNILDFVVSDVEETASPVDWSDADVAIAFRRRIESVG
jgi:hypothetical protein